MDLLTAVSVSMLPGSRSRVAAVFKNARHAGPGQALGILLGTLQLTPDGPELQSARSAASAALEAASRLGIHAIGWFDARFPALLACIPDPPPVIWIRGDPGVLARPAVAIVGSRAATTYALQVASRLAEELARRGIVVTSGLARGVDSSAHRGALAGEAATVAVLGSGLDRVYPAEHTELADRIADTGALLSELAPGVPPLPEHFPLRNRLISGISLGVVVVEASENSGSLITARAALDQGRDVMAVPGNVLSGRNRGSHGLLKDGAKVVESADDILEELGWAAGPATGRGQPGKSPRPDPLLAIMDAGEAYALDQLVEATGLNASRLLPRLMELELGGKVIVSGGRWMRA